MLEENCKLVSFIRDFFTRFDREKQSIVKIFTQNRSLYLNICYLIFKYL